MFDLSPPMIMTLIACASKACEFKKEFLIGVESVGKIVEGQQIDSILSNTMKLLADMDEIYPGIVPVPHDGIAWKERG